MDDLVISKIGKYLDNEPKWSLHLIRLTSAGKTTEKERTYEFSSKNKLCEFCRNELHIRKRDTYFKNDQKTVEITHLSIKRALGGYCFHHYKVIIIPPIEKDPNKLVPLY